ncbi:DUF4189 domain-containing protein [Variovorax paradoxus]|uniref:DUF4189 domain-containing protein n=1 Tax=Variovorax paradoxus TaxID=34073 RepID=UPI00359004FA
MYYSPTNAYCGPDPNYRAPQQTPQRPAEVWQDRYGAIYLDWTQGALGTSSNMASRPAAETAALADCKARGGVGCKQLNSYRNSCAAFSAADAGYASASDRTLDAAKQASMEECKNKGNTKCHVYYTDCSQPVRIQ